MSDTVIRVENLSKRYFITHKTRNTRSHGGQLTEQIQQWVSHPVRRMLGRKTDSLDGGKTEREEFWALKDVSFEVKRGDVLGIIGRNGAGKSTLLKILSRITEPTQGEIKVKGRIASLLEVGTGFHPELTGRENIFLNGSILGMGRAEIQSKFDEIVAFAEVERFLDTQVKHYSSGMYVRLAFAVAAHLEPEILIVDEVLAVGDAQFQKKCMGKMNSIASQGRTVIFVSHQMAAISRLTSQCAMLQRGHLAYVGPTSQAVQKYFSENSSQQNEASTLEGAPRIPGGNQHAILTSVRFTRTPTYRIGDPIEFVATFRCLVATEDLRIGLTVFAHDATPVGTTCSEAAINGSPGDVFTVQLKLPNAGLAPGKYHCTVALVTGYKFRQRTDIDIVPDLLHFDVTPIEGHLHHAGYWNDVWGRIILPDLNSTYALESSTTKTAT